MFTFYYLQNILGEFSKEQEAFIKGQQGGIDNSIPPWIGHQNEQKVKEEILGLSSVSQWELIERGVGLDFKHCITLLNRS